MHTYNLLRWNCNNFSNEVAQFLVGREIPGHVLSLPDDVMSTPLGQQLMPFLNMMEAQMRTASEQGTGGGMHQWTPPTMNHRAAPATAIDAATPTPEEAVPAAPEPKATPPSDTEDAVKKAATEDAVKARIETEIRAEFDRIMAAGGKTPNEAAAEALEIIRARAKEGKV